MKKPVTLSVWVDRTALDEAKRGAEARGTTVADEVRKVVARLATQRRRKPQKGVENR